MMTVHKLSAGDGYRYYTHEVASGDQLRAEGRELGDYYTVDGMPPGQWVGRGIGHLEVSGEVTEAQMEALFGNADAPIDPEKLREAFAEAHHKHEDVYARVMDQQRVAAAQNAWLVVEPYQQGATQEAIALKVSESLPEGQSIGQTAVAARLNQYRLAGNDIVKMNHLDGGMIPPNRQQFIDSYSMTPAETKHAESLAAKTAETESGDWLKAQRLGGKPREYQPSEFMNRVSEEVRRHTATQHEEPTGEQTKAIRNRVGGQLYRELHGRDATPPELVRFIANESKPKQQSVAGYDLVFTPVKSVSMAWGLGDTQLREGIEAAHNKAVAETLTYLEDNALYTRRGRDGVRQIDVDGGLIATKFRHYDNRTGDPNLHDHLVVANRVKGADGKWSTVDGRMFYQYNVAASEHYNARIREHLMSDLGVTFDAREQRGKKIWELSGFTPDMLSEFSSRRVSIDTALKNLERDLIERNGHAPTQKQRIALSQQATLATRPTKDGPRSLEQMNEQWQAQAKAKTKDLPLGEKLLPFIQNSAPTDENGIRRGPGGGDEPGPTITPTEHAPGILEDLEESKSTWRISDIQAATERYLGDTFPNQIIPTATVAETVAAVRESSIGMTPHDDLPIPGAYRRADGSSMYRVAGNERFTSAGVIAAEQHILDAAATSQVIPTATHDVFQNALGQVDPTRISAAQIAMAREFTTGERLLAVGIGPAGAGKTTSMKLTVATVEGAGNSVHGLAPTAAAASVMSTELGIQATTIDSLLGPNGAEAIEKITPGDMLLVDEIGMATSPKLSALLDVAEQRGAVVRGIGDQRQLAAIGAGGALRLIDQQVGAVHLEDVFRFRNADGTVNHEEVAASLALREPAARGEDKPFDWYLENGRVTAGDRDVMVKDLFTNWVTQTEAGKTSLMMAPTNDLVDELNELAQARQAQRGKLDTTGPNFTTASSHTVHAGDTIVTRQNARALSTNQGKDFVKNGDLWNVEKINADGSLKVQHENHHGVLTLPAWYTRENVELGYAYTGNRAQGAQAQTAGAILTSSTDRAGAYVQGTRGQEDNRFFVVVDETTTRDTVLETIAGNYDRDLSVHEQTQAERDTHRSVPQRLSKYEDLELYAQEHAMAHVAREALGRGRGNEIVGCEAWPALAHELADATEHGLDPAGVLARAHDQRDFANVEDDAAVLHWRIQGLRAADDAKLDAGHPRPFAAVPDEHLNELATRAAAKQPAPEPVLEDPKWHTREYGMTPTPELNARRAELAATMRENSSPQDRWKMAEMDAEVTRRRWSTPAQKEAEEIARGERARVEPGQDHHLTLAQALREEQKIRAGLLPTRETPEVQAPEKISRGVSGHTVSTYWQDYQYTPAATREMLGKHHEQIGELNRLRGTQIAEQKPVWAEALGEVPANPRNAERWYRVAGEVDAYRAKYNIADTEPAPVPKDYAASERGQYLAQQVVDVHKRGALSNRPARSAIENEATAEQVVKQRAETEQPSPAEQKIDPVTAERNAKLDRLMNRTKKNQPTQAPEKAEDRKDSMREKIRRIEEARKQQPNRAPGYKPGPEQPKPTGPRRGMGPGL
ncbi:relaxase domain-containing protein [Rothia sp. AR01]|uniref:Relaxase domain-containing protein n=1 Tax=Rothia santali TaxID=2949643 RepID=A0A9X2H9J6_9MICC|nr:MobF family relaxase [Rothia santali]MCP3425166.1 relaxase domain-containing protein [Rothia santali]